MAREVIRTGPLVSRGHDGIMVEDYDGTFNDSYIEEYGIIWDIMG